MPDFWFHSEMAITTPCPGVSRGSIPRGIASVCQSTRQNKVIEISITRLTLALVWLVVNQRPFKSISGVRFPTSAFVVVIDKVGGDTL